MATKSAGRVSIRVLPDSTRFKRDLETSLRRIENQLKAKIEAELYISRESLAKLKRQIESLVVKIKPTIELNISPEDIEALKAKIESMKPTVDVNLNTVDASRRIAALSRTRTINLIPVILGSKTVNNFVAKMKGLAGLNVLGDSFRGGIEFFQNIDRNAVKLGAMFTQMGALAAMAGTLAANMIVMTSQLASIGNLALLAPAFISGLGIGVSVLVVSLKDMKTVLADLGPQFTRLQNSISTAFWGQAEKPIRSLVKTLMPTLNKQLKETGKRMGSLFGEVAASVERNATPAVLERMFTRMNDAITISQKAINPLTRAFITLGDHGSKYFERFSKWIVKISDQFDAFIDKSAKNGNLDKWTENAIQGMKDLGNVTRGFTRIFNQLNRSAVASGAANMGAFGDALNRAADIMAQPRFQETMTRIFSGMNVAVDGILKGVAKLGPAIETASPTIFRVFSMIGDMGTRIGGMLATIISNPEFLAGFERLIAGVSAALYNLEPAMKPFADSLGGAMTLMGEILKSVSKVAAAFAVELMPELDKIGNEFGKLVGPFETTLTNLITVLKPLIQQLNTDVVAPLVALIKDEILPLFDKIVVFAGPSVKVVLDELKILIKDDLTPLFQKLNGEMDKSKGKAQETADAIALIMKTIPGMASGTLEQGDWGFARGGWLLEGGAERFKLDMDDFWRPIIKWWDEECAQFEREITVVWQKFEDWINKDFAPGVKKAIADAWDGLLSHFGFGSKGEENIKQQGEDWDKFWEGVKTNIKEGYEKFKTWVQTELAKINPIEEILDTLFGKSAKNTAGTGGMGGGAGGKGMSPGAKLGPGFFDEEAEKTWFQTLFDNIILKVQEFPGKMAEQIELWGESIGTLWNDFWAGLGTKVAEVWDGMLLWIQTKYTEITTGINTWIEEVKVNWALFWDGLGLKVQEIWQGFLDWINLKAAEIKLAIDTFIADTKANWEAFWAGVGTFLQTKWDEMVAWVNTKVEEIKANINRFISDVKTNWENFWRDVGDNLRRAWDDMVRTIETKVNEAIEWVKSLPRKAVEALSNLGEDLKSSGRSLIQGFIDGMGEMLENAKRTAGTIIQAIKDFFPNSPAKTGPLSGLGYTTYSGRALVKDFAGGMMDNMSKVRDATRKVADAASLSANLDLNNDLGETGIVVDRREVTLNVYHPVAEPTSRTIEKSANTLRMAGAI